MKFDASITRGARHVLRALGLSTLCAFTPSACTYDSDEPCGPNQKLWGDHASCVCVDGAALTDTGCVLCGENEKPGASGCVCQDGFAKSEDGCVPASAALGATCASSDECTDAKYDHCEPAGTAGYCTNTRCTAPTDCDSNYACDTTKSPSVCVRPPAGLMKSCTSNADCAGTEATHCDTFVTHACLVENCSLDPNNCFQGYECCDLSSFGIPQTLCVAAGACTT